MSDRSTIEFRSNIYPLNTKGNVTSDRPFLNSISDPFALDALWKHNATQGSLLTSLQKYQHRNVQPCIYAEKGDYPWGTRIVEGVPRVECCCTKWDCPIIGKCRPGVQVPETPQDNPSPEDEKNEPQVDEEEVVSGPEDNLQIVEINPVPPDKKPSSDDDEEQNSGENDVHPRVYPGRSKHYDDSQAAIVEADPSKRIYVTAGPGTGKTHTLIEKLKYLIDVQEVEPDSIIVMSFTRAAVQVVKDRLQKAALSNELENNWQAIDITTFDKFCTRFLFWLKGNAPEVLGKGDISYMDYDHRINKAAQLFRNHPELLEQCRHLVVDETQDLVGARSRLVMSLIESLPNCCGVTLLGDRCQSVYDYQASALTNSEAFFDAVQATGGFEEVTLTKNYRQNVQLPYSLDSMRASILSRDVFTAREQVEKILSSLGEPEQELRSLSLATLQRKLKGTLGILTRKNAQAIAISSLLYKHSVPHTLLRAEREAFWSRIVADVLIDYAHETIDEEHFVHAAKSKGATREQAMRAWVGLTSLRLAKPEGMRYQLENLLHAMSEEIVPESLSATKGVEPGITVSTIHGSKGREFDHVWLLQGDLQSVSKSTVLDEQKVAYVALSRARMETAIQKSNDGGLKIDQQSDRCYRIRSSKKHILKRKVKKGLTHIELRNTTDIDFGSLLFAPELVLLATSGDLEGADVRLCLPEKVPASGPVAYEIETEDGILLGKTALDFISYYEKCYDKVIGGLPKYLPEAFDELYVDKIVSCVGKATTAPATARRFGQYAVWYGFTLGGFAHVDNSQSH